MVRCFNCCNLIKSWKPTTKSDWLFEEKWKCRVSGEQFADYHLIHQERECKHYEKRPRIALTRSTEEDYGREVTPKPSL